MFGLGQRREPRHGQRRRAVGGFVRMMGTARGAGAIGYGRCFKDDGVAIYRERDGVVVRGVHGARSGVVGLCGVGDSCTGRGGGWEDGFYWDLFA